MATGVNVGKLAVLLAHLPADADQIVIKSRRDTTIYFSSDVDWPAARLIPNPSYFGRRFRYAIDFFDLEQTYALDAAGQRC